MCSSVCVCVCVSLAVGVCVYDKATAKRRTGETKKMQKGQYIRLYTHREGERELFGCVNGTYYFIVCK